MSHDDDAPDDPPIAADAEPAAPASAGPPGTPATTASRRLGLTSFTIEGRRAPALFVVAWLGTILGLGLTFVGAAAPENTAASVLVVVGLALLTIGLVAAAGSQAIERRAAADVAYAGPSPVLVFAAMLPATIVLLVVLFTPLSAAGVDPEGPYATLVGLLVTFLVYVGTLRLLVVGTGSLSWRDMGVRPPSRATLEEVAWAVALVVPVLFATVLVGVVLQQFLPPPPQVLPPATDPSGLLANLLTAAVLAPIGEELFFRGFATTAWARLHGPRVALVRGSIFFAIAHTLTLSGANAGEAIQLAATAFLVRLPVAFALGWLFLRRGSLYGPIALHAIFNGIQVLLLGVVGSEALLR